MHRRVRVRACMHSLKPRSFSLPLCHTKPQAPLPLSPSVSSKISLLQREKYDEQGTHHRCGGEEVAVAFDDGHTVRVKLAAGGCAVEGTQAIYGGGEDG